MSTCAPESDDEVEECDHPKTADDLFLKRISNRCKVVVLLYCKCILLKNDISSGQHTLANEMQLHRDTDTDVWMRVFNGYLQVV